MSKKKNSLLDEYATPITQNAKRESKKKWNKRIVGAFFIVLIAILIAWKIPKNFDVAGNDGVVIGNYVGSGFKSIGGKGTITLSDGTKIKGTFSGDKVDSDRKYTVTYENFGTYAGKIDDEFHPCGAGVYTNTDGIEIKSESWTWKKDSGTGYFGMMINDKRNGYGIVKTGTAIFEGEFLDNDYSGKVLYFDPDRTIRMDMNCAEGSLTGDVTVKYLYDKTIPEVTGRRKDCKNSVLENSIYGEECKFTGYTVNGKPVYGKMIFRIADKYAVYNGTFIDGKIGGKGTFTYTDGSSFEIDQNCEYKIDYTDSGNDKYTGMFVNKIAKGFGIYTFYDGNTYYKGEFGNTDGPDYGIETYKDGGKYIGEFKSKYDNKSDFIRDGYGVYTWKNGNIYEGNWKNDNICGFGRFTYTNGDIVEGEWTEDGDLPSGTITYKNGDTYTGQLTDLVPDGKGTMTWASIGTSFDGHFEKSILSGYGTYHSKLHGDISGIWNYHYDHKISDYWKYTGMFKDGVLCGYGVVEDSNPENPRTIYGEFMNNKLNGQVRVVQSNGAFLDSEVKDGDLNDIDGIYYLLV